MSEPGSYDAADGAAFAEVYRSYHQKLLRYCQYRLRDRHEAEDVMQEAFVRAWTTIAPTAYASDFYPWLRVVAGNLCTDVLRRRSRSQPWADIEPASVDVGLDRLTDEEDRELVRRALARLNERHRHALLMREDEGLTYGEIAERTGVSAGTVESLLWRARQALKKELRVIGGGRPLLVTGPLAALGVRPAGLRSRWWARTGRVGPRLGPAGWRAPGGPGSPPAVAHALAAALAAIVTVGGVAATFGAGRPGGPGASPTVVTSGRGVASRRAGGPMVAAALPAALPAPAGGVAAVLSPPTAPALAPAVAASWGSGAGSRLGAAGFGPAGPGAGTLRLADPVSVGPAAARSSRQAPVVVAVGPLVAIGLSPGTVTGYVGKTVGRVAGLLPGIEGGLSNGRSG
jgi:RNA polymerase sigma-70 factor (ECF subfamily)